MLIALIAAVIASVVFLVLRNETKPVKPTPQGVAETTGFENDLGWNLPEQPIVIDPVLGFESAVLPPVVEAAAVSELVTVTPDPTIPTAVIPVVKAPRKTATKTTAKPAAQKAPQKRGRPRKPKK